ncbi:hypothetical protein CK203_084738 [Vitis vinifera]|uniref:Uncharacterized protein n=1 Tax=Vitis vinifera TaxID=29760 RepID=A0A438EKD7_VITVI|nr:hypothetical protein CK203_084738 [Vitis vinifera]
MGRRHRHLIDEDDEENLGGDGGGDDGGGGGGGDDDDDGDDDVYMYPADMHPDERHAYREAVRASKAAEWNRQQQEHFIKGKRKTGESSHPTNPTTRQMRKSQSVRYSDASLPDAPSLYKSSAARQKTVKNLFKGGAIKETMGRLISKFFIYESVPPSKADSHHFKNMIVGAQQAEPPSPYEIKHKYLDMEYKDMEAYVNIQQRKVEDLWMHDYMRKVCGGDIVRPGATRFATNYIALDSLLKKKANLKKVFISDEWAQHNLSRTLIGKEVESLMFDHAYWERVGKLVSIYEALYTVLRIVDSEVVPTMPFVYELIRVMKENLIRLNAKEWVLEIIADRWDRTLKHPLHAAAFFLNPRFQYKRGVGTDPDLLQAVHEVFAKLDPTSEGLSQFGNEIILFRDAKEDSVIEQRLLRGQKWFPLNGGSCMDIRSYIKKVGHQGFIANCIIFSLYVTWKQNKTKLQRKITSIYLTLQLRIAAHVREAGVDVDRVLSEEVHTDSFSQDREIHFNKEFLSRQSLLDLLLTPRVLNIVVDLVLLVLLLPVMMVQEERGPMMVATLEMMKGMLDNNNKVDNHWHLLVKMISHIVLQDEDTALEEPVQVLEPLEAI